MAQAVRAAPIFTLYIQNIRLEGVNGTFLEIYFCRGNNELGGKGRFWGLDKIFWANGPIIGITGAGGGLIVKFFDKE
jgi:hypothetical protein